MKMWDMVRVPSWGMQILYRRNAFHQSAGSHQICQFDEQDFPNILGKSKKTGQTVKPALPESYSF
jgi:hypothetical protein